MKRRIRAAGACLLIWATSNASAQEYACAHTWEQLSRAVHAAATPAYRATTAPDLQALTATLSTFQAEAGECQSLAMDHSNDAPTRQRDIAEWRSLNEWLYRLANFVDQNSHGDFTMDWKREFETFAEVYELRL